MGGYSVDEDDGADEGDNEECQGEGEDQDGFFPGRHVGVLFLFGGWERVTGEEDEEEEHAVMCPLAACVAYGRGQQAYMKKKHVHWTPICAMPSNAAAQGNLPICLQHAMSLVLSGSVKMFAILAVPDTVPSRTNSGLRPREERRDIIL